MNLSEVLEELELDLSRARLRAENEREFAVAKLLTKSIVAVSMAKGETLDAQVDKVFSMFFPTLKS